MNKEKKTLLKLESVGFSKNNKWLVEGVSLEVKQGEIVTLIGPNGSGKSTTAKIALGIYKNIEGRVNKFTNKIGYVPQKISIDWTLPIRVIDFMSLIEEPTDEQINIALNLTGVEHLKKRKDDNLEIVISRYDTYMSSTKPVLDFYSKNSNFTEIDGAGQIDQITNKINEILKV